MGTRVDGIVWLLVHEDEVARARIGVEHHSSLPRLQDLPDPSAPLVAAKAPEAGDGHEERREWSDGVLVLVDPAMTRNGDHLNAAANERVTLASRGMAPSIPVAAG